MANGTRLHQLRRLRQRTRLLRLGSPVSRVSHRSPTEARVTSIYLPLLSFAYWALFVLIGPLYFISFPSLY